MDSCLIASGKKWREGKVRPLPGNPPHDRPVSRVISLSFWRICDDPFPATPFPQLRATILRRPVCAFKAWRNLSGPMWFQNQNQSQNQTPGRDRAASRWSAPSPGSRTRREDHALLIVRDEVPAGYSSIGLLASRARLRFTGSPIIKHWTNRKKGFIIER